ncbi:hypothetical protein LIX60_30615 [Streptomyces sp. S07_1.15]|uniref:hypothetical protein n=1 Tax=Streptomyces sp. S07_1.15 TaxID=2873925 RepID=UPI001D14273D|nr:hypothetical protein [Streptomyces sp. S07_1.15]MCC3655736.1 hypothetical protein [Streptomyces sp. S07_1.15]
MHERLIQTASDLPASTVAQLMGPGCHAEGGGDHVLIRDDHGRAITLSVAADWTLELRMTKGSEVGPWMHMPLQSDAAAIADFIHHELLPKFEEQQEARNRVARQAEQREAIARRLAAVFPGTGHSGHEDLKRRRGWDGGTVACALAEVSSKGDYVDLTLKRVSPVEAEALFGFLAELPGWH